MRAPGARLSGDIQKRQPKLRFALLVLVVLAGAVVAACGGGDGSPAAEQPPEAPKIEDPGPIHVHGLGINPKDRALFIATHTGLFRAPEGEKTAERVADRYQDTMGFTVIGPDRFLGSGHPDARENLPPFLGLIRSTDAGRTWEEVSLMGEADFHVLEAMGDRVYGFGSDYESRSAEFLVSEDGGRSWDKRPTPGPLVSLAISPDDPEHVVAAAQGGPEEPGLYSSADGGSGWQRLAGEVGLLTWTSSGSLFLVDGAGVVSESRNGGRSWAERGEIGGEPAAFEAGENDLYAALHDGTVKKSTDGGRSWSVRSRPEAGITP